MQLDELINKINTKAWVSPVQQSIINDCYKFFFTNQSQWITYFDNNYYIIGLSEDKYDYYWICIDNKNKCLKFITCLYDIDNNQSNITKQFNKEERKNIFEEVKKYFREHSDKENLIYLDEKLYN